MASTYNWLDNDHDLNISRTLWPANHLYQFSRTWTRGGHQDAISSAWPANHIFGASLTWTDGKHKESISISWPSGHSYEESKTNKK